MRTTGLGAIAALTISLFAGVSVVDAQACAPNCWTITGRIVGPQGEAVDGVDIDLFVAGSATEIPLSGDSTAIDGTFTLTIQQTIATGFYDLRLNPTPGSSYFPAVIAGKFLSGPEVLSADLVLDVGAILTGRVIDDLGSGLADVDLNFFIAGTTTELLFSGDVTNVDGEFEVMVTPGLYDIEFRETVLTAGGPYVEVFLENRPLQVNFNVGDIPFHDGHPLSGIVRDGGGAAVNGADVDVHDAAGAAIYTPGDTTDASGSFSVLVPVGAWQVEIDPPSGSSLVSQLIDTVVPLGGVSLGIITLPVGVAVSGTTVSGSLSPVPAVDLDFIISATGIEIPTAHDNAGPTGLFSVRVVTDTYDIQFRPPFATGLAPREILSVVVAADVSLGQVILDPGLALIGTVTDGGVPVEGVEVSLFASGTGTHVITFGNETDALGQYGLRQVAGTYDVFFTPLAGSGLPTLVETAIVLSVDTTLDADFSVTPIPTPPVTGLVCSPVGSDVTLDWSLGAPDYGSIEIRRDSLVIATLAGSATTYVDPSLPPATYAYEVIATRGGTDAPAVGCDVPIMTPPVTGLSCTAVGNAVSLDWGLGALDYGSIEILRDGLVITTLAGSEITYIDLSLPPATYAYEVIAIRGGINAPPVGCSATVAPGQLDNFVRADVNDSGAVDIADAVQALAYLFTGPLVVRCIDALDANDSGAVNIADPVFILEYLFTAGPPPTLPFPNPGLDPTPDGLPGCL